jgi:2-methylcitrate dehydratase PrpD
MSESLAIARHIVGATYDSLPPAVVDVTTRSLIDAIGVTLAASGLADEAKPFIESAQLWGAVGPCTVIGLPFKTSAPMAAFANGAMAHVLDFEDTHDLSIVHPNAATVPAALATAEALGSVSGKELITAIALGADLVCRLALGFKDSPQKRGWYLFPVMGAFGAAAAAGKLLGLTAEQLVQAFSLTICQATCSAELMNSPDSQLRAIRDAFTAKAGIVSAYLAKSGVTGFDRPFESKGGLYGLYGNSDFDSERAMRDLGQFYEGENISFKPWPSCRGAHSFVEAAIDLVRRHDIDIGEIAQVTAVASPVFSGLCEPLAQKQAPKTAIDAKFSIPFNVALALCYGTVSLAHFTAAGLAEPRVLAMASNVSCRFDNSLGLREATQGGLEIRMRSGDVHSRHIEFPLGHPNNPMRPEALRAKFVDCAHHARSPMNQPAAEALVERLLLLKDMKDIRDIGLDVIA